MLDNQIKANCRHSGVQENPRKAVIQSHCKHNLILLDFIKLQRQYLFANLLLQNKVCM